MPQNLRLLTTLMHIFKITLGSFNAETLILELSKHKYHQRCWWNSD